MKTRTNLKAGGMISNHNEAVVRDRRGLKVRSHLKAGGMLANHNEAVVRDSRTPRRQRRSS